MKTIKLLTFATAALVAAGFISATAQTTNQIDQIRPGHGRLLERISRKLELTDSQKVQIKTAWDSEKGTLVPLLKQWHDARRQLRDAIHASDASESAVRAAAANVASVDADLAVARMKLYGKMAPILTAEQRQKVAAFEQRLDDAAERAFARLGSPSDN